MQPVAITTLGRIAVTAADGRSLDAVLAQPKRLALLLYLAVAVPAGATVRRDTLLPVFWPDADDARARNALRQSVHFLRRELGPDVLRALGTEELGVHPDRVWCDAVALDAALAGGGDGNSDAAAAFQALWQGAFLPGFHLSGAPAWEQWADAERARRHAAAVAFAWAESDRGVAGGDAAAAIGWGQRAAALEPGSERALRRLIELCCRQGDVEAARAACAAFTRRLEAEGERLSRRVREWCEALSTHAALAPDPVPLAVPAPAPIVVTAPPPPPPPLPASATTDSKLSEPRSRELPPSLAAPALRRRRWPLAGAALVLAAAAGAWGMTRGTAAAAPPVAAGAPVRVVVAPFAVRGSGEWSYLADGMADLLAAKLDGAGALRTVDVRRVLGTPALRPGAGDDGAARDAAARLGAHFCVLGSVVALPGGRVQLRASLYPAAADSAAPVADGVVEGATAELPALAERLGADLLAAQLRGPAVALDREAVHTTRSFAAMRAYLRGRTLFRAGHFAESADEMRAAVAADTGFALARFRLAVAGQRGGDGTWPATAREALQRGGALPDHARRLLAGLVAHSEVRYADAERLFTEAAGERPDDVEAWEQLAEARYHGGPQRGVPAEASRATWERVLALDSANPGALVHLARLAAHRGDRAAFDTLSRRGIALEPDGERALELLGLRAVVLGSAADRARALAGVRAAGNLRAMVVALRVSETSENPAAARAFVQEAAAPARSRSGWLAGVWTLVTLELARGRWADADALLARPREFDPAWVRAARWSLLAYPFAPATPAALAEARAGVEAARRRGDRPPRVPPGVEYGAFDHRLLTPRGLTELAGLLAARAGDGQAALAAAAALDTMPAPTPPAAEPYGAGTPSRALGDAVRAHAALLAGADPAGDGGVGAAARAWRGPGHGDETRPYGIWNEAYPRFLRAEVLRRAGRPAEALRWYASVWEDVDAGLALAAPAHRAQAELLEQLGRPREAARHWRRFAELWADADPALQPQVRAARRRAAALGDPVAGL